VERAKTSVLYLKPEMPYTLGLLSSIPRMDKEMDRLDPIPGNPPSPINLPKGCVFQPRCFYWERVPDDLCKTTRPELMSAGPDHLVRCHQAPDVRREITAKVLGELAGVPS
jgi:peptide/nickel transport system ATP-binding protein